MENSINLGIPGTAIQAGKSITVFPNPVIGPDINIKIYSMQPGDVTLRLYELSGKQAGVKKDFRKAAEESTTTMPVGMLENGMYILSVTGKDWTVNKLINIIR